MLALLFALLYLIIWRIRHTSKMRSILEVGSERIISFYLYNFEYPKLFTIASTLSPAAHIGHLFGSYA